MDKLKELFVGLDPVQMFRFKLLTELDVFFSENNIDYSVTDELLVALLRNEPLKNFVHNISVAMTPSNYFKFLGLAATGLTENRVVENIFNNPYYPNNTARYVATDTLSMNIIATPYLNKGIYIKIKILPPVCEDGYKKSAMIKQNKILLKVKSLSKYLYKPLRVFTYPVAVFLRRKIIAIKRLDLELERNSNWIILKLRNDSESIKVPISEFNEFECFAVNGFTFKVSRYLIENGVRVFPRLSLIKYKPKHPQSYVESAVIGFREYENRGAKKVKFKLYCNGVFDKFYLHCVRLVEKDPFSMNKYLSHFAFRFYIFKISKELLPKLDYIQALVADRNISELRETLELYARFFDYFYRKKKLMVVNQGVFEAYLFLLCTEGKGAYVTNILKCFSNEYPEIKIKEINL